MQQETPVWDAWLTDCRERGLPVASADMERYRTLYTNLVAYNENVNLTRITGLSDFLVRHLLESLAISPFLPDGCTLVDIGTGAGFPALPLAMARPDVRVTAVDSVGKKCAFITQMKETLDLKNLTVLHARSEEMGRNPQYREHFDMATARALAPIRTLLELTTPLIEPGGALLAIKGSAWQTEVDEARKAMHMLKTRLRESQPLFAVPPAYGETQQYDSMLLIFEKEDHTPAVYPRQAGTPKKNPL